MEAELLAGIVRGLRAGRLAELTDVRAAISEAESALSQLNADDDWSAIVLQDAGVHSLLAALTNHLLNPTYTAAIVRVARSVLLTLLQSALSSSALLHSTSDQVANALCIILRMAPQYIAEVVQFFETSPCPFDFLATIPDMTAIQDPTVLQRIHSIARSVYCFLDLFEEHFSPLWHWAPFFQVARCHHLGIRWYAARICAMVLRLKGEERKQWLQGLNVLVETAESPSQEEELLSIEALELREKMGDTEESVALFTSSATPSAEGSDRVSVSGRSQQIILSEETVSIGGIRLRRRNTRRSGFRREPSLPPSLDHSFSLVHVDTTVNNLRRIALSFCEDRPILLEGPSGSGKTVLLREFARLTDHADLVEIHLDDQIDSKTLLGTYLCTEVPGEFVWQPGVLTQALREGRWVMIEDIDRAPFEIIAALLPLVEEKRISLAGRGETITAAPGFRLFATRSTGHERERGRDTGVGGFNDSLWSCVPIAALKAEELVHILQQSVNLTVAQLMVATFIMLSLAEQPKQLEEATLVDQLGKVAPGLIHILDAVREKLSFLRSLSRYRRVFTVRDLLKWVKRVTSLGHIHPVERGDRELEHVDISAVLTESERQSIVSEAVDIFTAGMQSKAERENVSAVIAAIWRIRPEVAVSLCSSAKPRLETASEYSVAIGRITLPIVHGKRGEGEGNRMPFANTGHALRLMERVAAATAMREPLLLVGETGCGKTTAVQQLARLTGQQLVVQNLNIQSDSADLLGGFKPVELRQLALPLYLQFQELFPLLFSKKKNASFLFKLKEALEQRQWKVLSKGLRRAVTMAESKVGPLTDDEECSYKEEQHAETEQRKDSNGDPEPKTAPALRGQWRKLAQDLARFERQREQVESSFAFSFVEGSLVKAMRDGSWVLLDEINLASSETLQRLSNLLEGENGTLSLMEKGDIDPVVKHPRFRLFAAMNPPTDVGKKDLAPALRNRFTELYVDEMEDVTDLQVIVQQYLKGVSTAPISEIVTLYLELRKMANEVLADGARQKPKYSLRTLSRSLETTLLFLDRGYGLQRSLLDAFGMSFATQLDKPSRNLVEKKLMKAFGKGLRPKDLQKPPSRPGGRSGGEDFCLVTSFWIRAGDQERVDLAQRDPTTGLSKFVVTPSVEVNLRNLARAATSGKYPILLQGPTSTGKTSIVEYLAALSGHKCVRINNHEHTDIQEYMGSYNSDETGRLVFQEGILVEAVRRGWWIILDELNLAPSEVLEALNRLLDDNRELFIPETQETVLPHPNFMLFATQNPPGLYGGRKVLSRAFRNRFLEMQVDEIPGRELQRILTERCSLPPSYCEKLVAVMQDLQIQHSQSSVFAGKEGFITTRDLLRWAQRRPQSKEALAKEGYYLLAERLRRDDEKELVRKSLEKCIGVKLPVEKLYDLEGVDEERAIHQNFLKVQEKLEALRTGKQGSETRGTASGLGSIAFTNSMRRLFTLVGKCLANKEPVLLVGETGCGKTTVCQLYSILLDQPLHILNCHQHTETADLLGSLRPVRHREDKLVTEVVALLRSYLQEAVVSGSLPSSSPVLTEWETLLSSPSGPSAHELLAKVEGLFKVVRQGRSERVEEAYRIRLLELEQKICAMKEKRQALFEWQDGPLVSSMRNGDLFLLDEISLAEDAVLERLNSVLEPSRSLTLAEKGGSTVDTIVASPAWRIFATMNPGGDYGKRELSPALRNRFTEIWVPAIHDHSDLTQIIEDRLVENGVDVLRGFSRPMLELVRVFNEVCAGDSQSRRGGKGMQEDVSPAPGLVITLRDILSWSSFMNEVVNASHLKPWQAYLHGICMILLDGMGLGSGLSPQTIRGMKLVVIKQLQKQLPPQDLERGRYLLEPFVRLSLLPSHWKPEVERSSSRFGISPFYLSYGPVPMPESVPFAFNAPTTAVNLLRVLRALQLKKPILLEGSPGVGKTSLIANLAKATGHTLVRINLSEQTDVADLFGSDLPLPDQDNEGTGASSASSTPRFAWCDGVFLRALKAGSWVLLDELNLAPQAVLEGLNSVLDHRSTVYIPEIDQWFECPPGFRIFAAQNPLQQGGGRKGLPRSFLNRFSKVHMDSLSEEDLSFTATALFPHLAIEAELNSGLSQAKGIEQRNNSAGLGHRKGEEKDGLLEKMLAFNQQLYVDTMEKRAYGRVGSPWEFNLRDVFRWCELLTLHSGDRPSPCWTPDDFVDLMYLQRMRTAEDREAVVALYRQVFKSSPIIDDQPEFKLTPQIVQIGRAILHRSRGSSELGTSDRRYLLRFLLRPMEAVAHAVARNWPALIVGSSASGKTTIVRLLAEAVGQTLHEIPLTSGTDASELVGCFEQMESGRGFEVLRMAIRSVISELYQALATALPLLGSDQALALNQQILEADWLLKKKDAQRRVSTSPDGVSMTIIQNALDAMRKASEALGRADSSFGRLFHAVNSLQHRFEGEREKIKRERSSGGMFEWIDGALVRAMEEGHWVLLENVNYCSSSVLDRLNPLLETQGELLIAERGTVDGEPKVVRPHRNFRIFLTMNPEKGEISRAMRNRCVEIYLLQPVVCSPSIARSLPLVSPASLKGGEQGVDVPLNRTGKSRDVGVIDCMTLLQSGGVIQPEVALLMILYHQKADQRAHSTPLSSSPNLRHLSRWASLTRTMLHYGFSMSAALLQAFGLVYKVTESDKGLLRELERAISNLFTSRHRSMSPVTSPLVCSLALQPLSLVGQDLSNTTAWLQRSSQAESNLLVNLVQRTIASSFEQPHESIHQEVRQKESEKMDQGCGLAMLDVLACQSSLFDGSSLSSANPFFTLSLSSRSRLKRELMPEAVSLILAYSSSSVLRHVVHNLARLEKTLLVRCEGDNLSEDFQKRARMARQTREALEYFAARHLNSATMEVFQRLRDVLLARLPPLQLSKESQPAGHSIGSLTQEALTTVVQDSPWDVRYNQGLFSLLVGLSYCGGEETVATLKELECWRSLIDLEVDRVPQVYREKLAYSEAEETLSVSSSAFGTLSLMQRSYAATKGLVGKRKDLIPRLSQHQEVQAALEGSVLYLFPLLTAIDEFLAAQLSLLALVSLIQLSMSEPLELSGVILEEREKLVDLRDSLWGAFHSGEECEAMIVERQQCEMGTGERLWEKQLLLWRQISSAVEICIKRTENVIASLVLYDQLSKSQEEERRKVSEDLRHRAHNLVSILSASSEQHGEGRHRRLAVSFWKRKHPAIPTDRSSWEVYDELLATSSSFEYKYGTNSGQRLSLAELLRQTHPTLYIDGPMKAEMAQAVATLYWWMHQDKGKRNNSELKALLIIVKDRGSRLRQQFLEDRKQQSVALERQEEEDDGDAVMGVSESEQLIENNLVHLSHADSVLARWADIQTWAVHDHWAIRKEKEIASLLQLVSLLLMTEYEKRDMPPHQVALGRSLEALMQNIQETIELLQPVLEQRSFATPEHMGNLLTLRWLVADWMTSAEIGQCSGATERMTEEQARRRRIWLRSFFSATQMFLLSVEKRVWRLPALGSLSHELSPPLLQSEINNTYSPHSSSAHLNGPVRFNEGFSTAYTLSLLKELGIRVCSSAPTSTEVSGQASLLISGLSIQDLLPRMQQLKILQEHWEMRVPDSNESDSAKDNTILCRRALLDSWEVLLFLTEAVEGAGSSIPFIHSVEAESISLPISTLKDAVQKVAERLPDVANLFLVPMVQVLERGNGKQEGLPREDALRLLCLVGLLKFTLLLPASPLDPTSEPRVRAELQEQRLTRLFTKWFAAKCHEEVTNCYPASLSDKGYPSSPNRYMRVHEGPKAPRLTSTVIHQEGDVSLRELERLREEIVERPQQILLHGLRSPSPSFLLLFQQLQKLSSSLLQPKRVLELLDELLASSHTGNEKTQDTRTKEERVLAKENVWQASVDAFLSRLSSEFSGYRDIWVPLSLSVYDVREALRLSARHLTEQRDKQMQHDQYQVLSSLLGFTLPTFSDSLSDSHPLAPTKVLYSPSTAQMLVGDFSNGKVRSARHLKEMSKGESTRLKLTLILVALQRLVRHCTTSKMDARSKGMADELFTLLCSLWAEQQEEERQKKEKERELIKYKIKEEPVEDELTREEMDFRERFPDFQNADFADILGQNPGESNSDNQKDHSDTITFTQEDIQVIYAQYQRLFLRAKVDLDAKCKGAEREERQTLVDVLDGIAMASQLAEVASTMPQSIDWVASGSFVVLLSALSSPFEALVEGKAALAIPLPVSHEKGDDTPEDSGERFMTDREASALDFNSSPCPSEVQLLSLPLKNYLRAVGDLLRQWPGHAVLHQLAKIADRIRRFPITSPLGKVLSGLELLLRKSQEWEEVAASSFSLSTVLSPLSALVSRWRRLELRSWPQLLQVCDQRAVKSSQRLWFDLFRLLNERYSPKNYHEILAGGSDSQSSRSDCTGRDHWNSLRTWLNLHSSALWSLDRPRKRPHVGDPEGNEAEEVEEGDEEYLLGLAEALDQFLRSSTVGQFLSRLEMLQSFWGQFQFEMSQMTCNPSSPDLKRLTEGRERIAFFIFHLSRFYEQFLSALKESVGLSRGPIERKLKEHAKISKWDEQSYYSLAESAEKSHRRLHKLVREYEEEVLSKPMEGVFSPFIEGGLAVDAFTALDSDLKLFQSLGDQVELGKQENPEEEQETDHKAMEKTRKKRKKSNKRVAQNGQKKTPGPLCLTNRLTIDELRCLERMKELDSCWYVSLSSDAYCILTSSLFLRTTAPITLAHQSLGKTHSYASRMRELLSSFLSDERVSEKRRALGEICEEYSSSILSRMHNLRAKDAPKAQKKRALVDFLKAFQEEGLSFRSASVPLEQKDPKKVFSLPALATVEEKLRAGLISACTALTDTSDAGKSGEERSQRDYSGEYWLWKRADDYFYRSFAQIQALRTDSSSSFSGDLSSVEVEKMVGFSEHLFYLVIQQRQLVLYVVKAVDELDQLSHLLQSLEERPHDGEEAVADRHRGSGPYFSSARAKDWLTYQLQTMQTLYYSLSRLLLLLQSQKNPSQAIRNTLLAIRSRIQARLEITRDLETRTSKRPEVFGRQDFNVLEDNLKVLRATQKQMASLGDREDEQQRKNGTQAAVIERSLASVAQFLDRVCESTEVKKMSCLLTAEEMEHEHQQRQATLPRSTAMYGEYVEELLLVAQKLYKWKRTSESRGDNEAEEPEHAGILNLHSDLCRFLYRLDLGNLVRKTEAAMQEAFQYSPPTTSSAGRNDDQSVLYLRSIASSSYFLSLLSSALKGLLLDLLSGHKAVAKLTLIAIRVSRNLTRHGFCQSPEGEEEDGEGQQGSKFTDDVEGTGMGEGEGKKDVSDQIEDEEQLLGLKGEEKQENQEPSNEDKKKGLEMENDFEGTLEDVEEDEQDEEKDGDDEEKEELDREMGELDDEEEEVVDERLWGDESDDEDDIAEQEKYEKDAPISAPPEPDEVRGKEDQEDSKDNEKDKPEGESPPEESADKQANLEENLEEEEEKVNEDQEGAYEENHHNPLGPEDDQEEHVEDLPEDMNLDEEGQEQEENGNDDENGEDEGEKEQEEVENPTAAEEEDPGLEEEDRLEEMDLENRGTGEVPEEKQQEEEEGKRTDEEEQPPQQKEEKTQPERQRSNDQAFGVEDQANGDEGIQQSEEIEMPRDTEEDQRDDQEDIEDEKREKKAEDDGDKDPRASRRAGESGEEEMDTEKIDMNPYKDPESAIKEWRRRLKIIREELGQANQEDQESADDAEKGEGEEDQSVELTERMDEDTKTTLAPTKDMTDSVEHQDREEEEEEDDKAEEAQKKYEPKMDKEKPEIKDEMEDKMNSRTKKEREATDSREEEKKDAEPQIAEENIPEPSGLEEEDMQDGRDKLTIVTNSGVTAPSTDTQAERTVGERKNVDQLREELDKLMFSSKPSYTSDESAALWSMYCAVTGHLSQRLCEQLRLILEPLLATKLQGDYRTGKRLNMRRVIPYIASQYRKDKIWMRRTKPSKRTYQVMVAIDDSQSMVDNHAGRLALEAMTTVCKALSQLEVGDIAVTSFGESLALLQDFNQPFTDESGARIISNFHFAQQRTHMAATLDMISEALHRAREERSSSGGESMQLVFLISDGRYDKDGRDSIARRVREAEERNQLVVLIIIDHPEEKSSILNTKSVAFVNGKVQVSSYMESFPFPYYLIVRDINLLPEALSDALRQWFELVQRQQSVR